MQLAVPISQYKVSFLEALREYQREEISERDIRHDLVSLYPNILAKSFDE